MGMCGSAGSPCGCPVPKWLWLSCSRIGLQPPRGSVAAPVTSITVGPRSSLAQTGLRERCQQRAGEGASSINTGEISLHIVTVILSCSVVPLFQIFLIMLLNVGESLISVFGVVLSGTAQDNEFVCKQGQTDFSVPDFNLSLYIQPVLSPCVNIMQM